MRLCLALWALALLPCAVRAKDDSLRQAPSYAASALVNLATGLPGPFAPNTLVALYGRELSSSINARDSSASGSSSLPAFLGVPPVHVKINGFFAPLEYVSPEVVVFLIPADQFPGPANIRLARNNIAGPLIQIVVEDFAPALFELEMRQAFARHATGLDEVSALNPATPGETIILYAAGLGEAERPLPRGEVPSESVAIRHRNMLRVLLDGEAVDARYIVEAGMAAGRPGCYEIVLRLPADTPADPEIRIAMGDGLSQAGLRLAVQWKPAGGSARTDQ